jgi:hypothetical protein
MIERKPVLTVIALIALVFVSVPSVLFNTALVRYFNFMDQWSAAAIRPSHNAQLPPMHARTTTHQADNLGTELRFVKFTVRIANAKTVRLGGDFNKWNLDSLTLIKRDKNVWGTIIPLPPGVYKYLYKIDGQVILDPLNPDTAMLDDRKVSVLTVK